MKHKLKSHDTVVPPFLRWAGSKRQHRSFLKSFWSNQFGRYVEPFAGSAVLFFEILPCEAILGDINKELIETFEAVRSNPAKVHRALSLLSRSSTQYYKVRRVDPGELTSIERAARFIYLNRLCFNGLYRTNTRGQFNVPYGGAKSGNIPTLEHLKACSKYLKRARLIHADFRKTLALVQKGDFVYLDPPYAVSNRRVFVEYGAKPFAVEDIKILGQHLRKIDKRGAKFVLSYADCSEARKTFAKWSSRRVLTHRNVAGFAGDRKSQYEIYVTNCQSIPNR